MKRRGGGGNRLNMVNQTILLRRLQSCRQKYHTVDDIVEHLRLIYPDYRRHKLPPFSRIVGQTLKSISADDEGEEDVRRPAVKKLRKGDPKEEKLLDMEAEHQKRSFRFSEDSSDATSSSSSSSSTSDDAIYGEEVVPEFDLMKSMLRDSYVKKSDDGKIESVEKNVELDVGGGKDDKEIMEMGRKGRREKSGNDNSKGKETDEGGVRFKDLGGMNEVLEELRMEILVPLYHPDLPRWLGVNPTSGILLHGPPGCGKTKLAHAIANETGLPFYKISATEVVSGVSGASEENIRELFLKAHRTAPSIVFIDEIDAIASKRENLQREMERRIVTQLMTCMDSSYQLINSADAETNSEKSGYVLVIGATNRPDAVDSALRRPGRFDREIMIGVPDENARVQILSVLTRNLRLEGSFDLLKIARSTPGFVGADLTALASKAGNLAMKRIMYRRRSELCTEPVDEEHNEDWWKHPWSPEDMEKLNISMADFEEAAKLVQPSLRREGFSAIPSVKWEDIGGLDSLRKEFERCIVSRIKYPEDDKEFGVDLEKGFLLYGPPGCGKTLIAKAVANEAGANFIHVKGPEILNKYVGESELAVRTMFSRARTCSPCILFLDEVDALTTTRGKEGGWVVERLLNQLLIELDGADQRRGVFVIGATNRPEVIDPAVLRPGRFGKLVYVPLPGPDERGLILKALAKGRPIDPDVDLDAIGRREACTNLSGSDLYKLLNEAADAAKVEKQERMAQSGTDRNIPSTINMAHFEQALTKITPSVSDEEKQYYQILSKKFRSV